MTCPALTHDHFVRGHTSTPKKIKPNIYFSDVRVRRNIRAYKLGIGIPNSMH